MAFVLAMASASTAATLDVRAGASSNDAEESGGSVNLSSSDLELVTDGSSVQTVGIRWGGITIPPGATITAAYIQFAARDAQTTATNLLIRGQAADNAAAFATTTNNISGRPRTVAQVSWSPISWPTAGAAGLDQRTPDLTAIVQEIVDRAGWGNGNALAVIITGTGRRNAWAQDGNASLAPLLHVEFSTLPPPENPPVASLSLSQPSPLTVRADASASTDVDLTPIASYEFDFGDGSPLETVLAPNAVATHTYAVAGTYTVTLIATDTGNFPSSPVSSDITVTENIPGSTERRIAASNDDAEEVTGSTVNLSSGDLELIQDGGAQTVGLRWTAVAIPVGATITSAYVQFAAREAQSEVTNLVIRGQAADNPATFASGAGNVSTRPRTTATVNWSPPAWAVGQAGPGQQTPDLRTVIQEIVDRGGWASGNALAIIINGTGHRTAWSFNGQAASAPLLHVEFLVGPPPPDFPPVAGLSVAQISSPPFTVTADGSTSTDGDLTPIATYQFDFGDGSPLVTTTAPVSTATHTYAGANTYTVSLVATDTGALESAPVSADVTVVAPPDFPPVATLSVTQTAPLTARADASGSTDTDFTPIASYAFDFGDGSPVVTTTAPTSTATHSYSTTGTYPVTVIVTDTANNPSDPVTTNVTVDERIPGSVERRIASSNDDAEQLANSSPNLSSSDLELIQDSAAQTVGLRWTGVTIPIHATIDSAYIQFVAKEAQSEVTNLVLRGQAADNPPAFASGTNNVSARSRTVAAANWSPGAWAVGAVGPNQRTSDLKNVIQEIVNRPGWASGNALAIIIDGTGHRTTWAFDGQAASAALLRVFYYVGPPPPENPPIAGLSVTQNATPPLTVTADGSTSTDVDWTPVASYQFDFGDGSPPVVTTAPVATATHTYSDVATYTVTLIATDTGGSPSDPVSTDISVTPPPDDPPVAALSVTQIESPPLTVTADASGSTDTDFTPIATYEFDFGDGSPVVITNAPTATASHTYDTANTYTVTVKVTDSGSQASPLASASISVTSGYPAVLERRVAASSDDAEEPSGASVNLSSSDLEMTQDSAVQTVGLRWTGINIPKGSVINGAYIQFTASEARSEATNLILRGQAADNAATFTSTAGNVSGRGRTSATVNWAPPSWAAGAAGLGQRTPDLKNIIQEIVNRSGWSSGNALAVIVTGTGRRTAWSFNGQSTGAALLHIDYLSNTPPTDDPPVARLTVTQDPSPPRTVTADASASTDGDLTPIASYRFTFGDGTSAVTTAAPASTATHTYATTGTYTVTLTATDTGGQTPAPVTSSVTIGSASSSNVAVYVGYYDTHHTSNAKPKPNPWRGATNVTFVGTEDPGTSNGWDTSAIRIDNLGSTSLSGVAVTVTMGSKNFALWGTQSIPAGRTLILAQTGFENFDGSDTSPAGCYDCNPNMCVTEVSSAKPVVKVTIGGTLTQYIDTGQVMNTKGADGAGCPYTGTRNDESSNWVRVFPSTAAPNLPAGSEHVADTSPVVRELFLSRPTPNPTDGVLGFEFAVPVRGAVRLGVYDIQGRHVREYLDEVLDPGDYRGGLRLNGLSPGMYFLGLRTPSGDINRAFVLIK